MSTQTTIKKSSSISPIWILPIVAAAICGWLLYKSYMETGIDIEVFFDDASGIIPEKTQVMYMGIPVGMVKSISADLKRQKVLALIRMERTTEKYLVEDTSFWLVRPEVSADRITGLDTILSGGYIGVRIGKSTLSSRTFTAFATAPPLSHDAPGLHITLKSSSLRSIQEGSAIYFKNIKVGSVQSFSLQKDESILIDCHILPRYAQLIHKDSRFYDASGISFTGKLTNLKVRMESLSSLFVGGIVVSTPDLPSQSPPAENGDAFPLFEDYEASKYGLSMTLKLASGENISEGVTKVMYRGLEAGYVDHISINDDARRSVTAHILLDPRAGLILKEGTAFWIVSPSFSVSGISNANTLLSGPYITFRPGEGEYRDDFEISHEPPVELPLRPGKTFRLHSPEISAAAAGSPVYYRKIAVGEVLGSSFTKDRTAIETTIFIEDGYTDLVKPSSIFIESSGIALDASISGLSLSVDPLLSMIKGGIDLINPLGTEKAVDASGDSVFTLYKDMKEAVEAETQLKRSGLHLTLTTEELDSYRVGTPILYKKIKVGEVTGFRLAKAGDQVDIHCLINPQYAKLVNRSSRFYNTSGIRLATGQGGLKVETGSLESIIAGGIAFYTPSRDEDVGEFHTFAIHDSLEKAEALDHASIQVTFQAGEGLSPGAAVKYNGIPLGYVAEISFTEDLKGIQAELSIEKRYLPMFRKGTQIWLAQPKINLKGVKNLETVLFGAFLSIQPGSGELAAVFTGLNSPPQKLPTDFEGLNLTLEAKQLNSIEAGSPIYYRRVKIGEVTGYDLAFDFKDVLIHINIESRYAPIVRRNTRFWNASGVRVEGGLFSGIAVATQSLEAIMAGGIALATPEKEAMGAPVASGFRFLLHEKPEAEWLDWNPDIFTITQEPGVLPSNRPPASQKNSQKQ